MSLFVLRDTVYDIKVDTVPDIKVNFVKIHKTCLEEGDDFKGLMP